MRLNRLAKVSLITLTCLSLAAIAAGVTVVNIDWKPVIEARASDSLERPLRIGALTIDWGNPTRVEIKDLTLANAAFGSEPEMIRIASASGDVALWPLLKGELRYRTLNVAGLHILLERDKDGRGNWEFGSGGGSGGIVPKNRREFPTLLKAVLDKGDIRYRTGSGKTIAIGLSSATIRSAGESQPVLLAADGSYNGNPINLVGETASFEVLRDASLPFGTNLSLASRTAVVDFQGSMMEPLDFEGVRGRLTGRANSFSDLLRVFGSDIKIAERFEIDGIFARTGDRWTLNDANGRLADSILKGNAALTEHPRGEPDEITVDLGTDRMDFDRLTKGLQGGKSDPALTMASEIDTRLALRLDAGTARYKGWQAEKLSLETHLAPGSIAVKRLSFGFGNGTILASGTLASVGRGGRLELTAAAEGVEAATLAQRLGNDENLLTGKIDIRADLAMEGRTWTTGLRDSDGSAVFAMTGGRAARAMVEKLSTDIRGFLREGSGQVGVGCFYSTASLRKGVATLAPLRLRTGEAAFNGGGTIDLPNRTVDIRVKSDREASGTLALDIPLHISGAIADPGVGPGKDAPLPAAKPVESPYVKELADKKACR
ncbi:AsmA-like C-terminal region-containing protein [Lacibacterium aquatile]|uniref:AsmA-like C-terminal region-containing protein n=1 Tax=Lacibacterium aquatile TaxID=1168082 RepID=A0ABW5DST0_9PROT